MQARCPYCQSIFEASAPGVQQCPRCQAQVNVPAAAPSAPQVGAASCAQHPDRVALATCERCGNFMCAECNLSGQSRLCPRCREVQGGTTVREPTSWERRSELGFFKALFETWKKTILEPEKFWAALQPRASVGDALLYGWLLSAVSGVMGFLMAIANIGGQKEQIEQVLSQMKNVPEELERFFRMFTESSVPIYAALFLGGVLLYPLSFVISSVLLHLGCLVFGAAKNGFAATARIVGYSSAPAVFSWVPMLGAFMAIYVMVLQGWGVARAQESTVARAVGAVLFIPVLAMCCVCLGGVAAGIAAAQGR